MERTCGHDRSQDPRKEEKSNRPDAFQDYTGHSEDPRSQHLPDIQHDRRGQGDLSAQRIRL